MNTQGSGLPSDASLLGRIRNGDEEALTLLLARHERAMRAKAAAVLGKGLGRRISVSDVLQEARLAAFESLADFEGSGSGAVRGWLLRVVELKAIDAVRRNGAAKRDAHRETAPATTNARESPVVDKSPTPGEAAATGELTEISRRALAALPEDYREVLRLSQLNGLSLRQTAECMGRSHEATKKLYGRALARFGELVRRSAGRRHEP